MPHHSSFFFPVFLKIPSAFWKKWWAGRKFWVLTCKWIPGGCFVFPSHMWLCCFHCIFEVCIDSFSLHVDLSNCKSDQQIWSAWRSISLSVPPIPQFLDYKQLTRTFHNGTSSSWNIKNTGKRPNLLKVWVELGLWNLSRIIHLILHFW